MSSAARRLRRRAARRHAAHRRLRALRDARRDRALRDCVDASNAEDLLSAFMALCDAAAPEDPASARVLARAYEYLDDAAEAGDSMVWEMLSNLVRCDLQALAKIGAVELEWRDDDIVSARITVGGRELIVGWDAGDPDAIALLHGVHPGVA